MFAKAGFEETEVGNAAYTYLYNASDDAYENEKDISNTFCLRKDDCYITLYFQPVIHSDKFENNITLYRTTTNKGYFAPDFAIKIQHTGTTPIYFILDSKYSSRANIRKHYIDDTILRYSCQIADVIPSRSTVKMVWLLQGRVDETSPVWKYQDSPMSVQYKPEPSYGILSINTRINMIPRLWREIETFL